MEMRISPVDDCVWINDSGSLMVDGDTPKEAHDAAMKINNHDRLVEENAKLREMLEILFDECEKSQEVTMVHSGETLDKLEKLLTN